MKKRKAKRIKRVNEFDVKDSNKQIETSEFSDKKTFRQLLVQNKFVNVTVSFSNTGNRTNHPFKVSIIASNNFINGLKEVMPINGLERIRGFAHGEEL